jgi:hypothetical protein
MDATLLFVRVFTGAIGYAAWAYGRRTSSARHMGLGFVLVAYSWFVDDPALNAGIGATLTLLLFFPR